MSFIRKKLSSEGKGNREVSQKHAPWQARLSEIASQVSGASTELDERSPPAESTDGRQLSAAFPGGGRRRLKSKFKSGARRPAQRLWAGRAPSLLLLLTQPSHRNRRPLTAAPRAPRAASGGEQTEPPPCPAPPGYTSPRGWHLPEQRHHPQPYGTRLPCETARLASPSSSRRPLPLLPAAGRTNPLGPG